MPIDFDSHADAFSLYSDYFAESFDEQISVVEVAPDAFGRWRIETFRAWKQPNLYYSRTYVQKRLEQEGGFHHVWIETNIPCDEANSPEEALLKALRWVKERSR